MLVHFILKGVIYTFSLLNLKYKTSNILLWNNILCISQHFENESVMEVKDRINYL